eukprot:116755-Pelagomonas_calceolata.AAC.1
MQTPCEVQFGVHGLVPAAEHGAALCTSQCNCMAGCALVFTVPPWKFIMIISGSCQRAGIDPCCCTHASSYQK